MANSQEIKQAIFEYCLRLGDNGLVLGQRLGEWCGHGPILEEDIALTNISLDLIGQARLWYTYAGEVEGKGRKEDDLAYFRDEREFRNLLLVEQPNGDFAYTITRQFLYSAYAWHLFQALKGSKDEQVAAIAAKSLKETTYHLRHSSEWMIRLGDGTEESHERVQRALDDLWMFTGELFEMDETDRMLVEKGIGADLENIRSKWEAQVKEVVEMATLALPEGGYMATGSRTGIHTEHLGHMLAEMQSLARAFPGATW